MAGTHIVQVRQPLVAAMQLANAADITTLPEKAAAGLWKNLRAADGLLPSELGKFPGIGMAVDPGVLRRQLDELQSNQQTARELLARKSAGELVEATMKGLVTISGSDVRFRGPETEVFRMGLAWALSSDEGDRVRRCPECAKFFLRVRRQIYCSDFCTDRATWKKYPESKKKQARKREYAKHGWTFGARSKRKADHK